GPYGIGRLDGRALMVPHTAPGDRVLAHIIEARERYSVGELIRVITPSPLRQAAPCVYVPECGGCSWQHMLYEAQLKAKQQSVADALQRIGKLADFELRPIIASPKDHHYRRRIRLQCDERKRLGFYRSSSHQLIEIDRCVIADDRINGVIELLRPSIAQLRTQVEHVEIIHGDGTEQVKMVIGAAGDWSALDEDLCEQLVSGHSAISGLVAHGPRWRKVWGQPWITVQLTGDLAMTVDADVFTQVNPEGNRKILSALLASAAFTSDDRVLELYCGAGNFTLPIAAQAKEVVAVEGYRPAIANGKLNAQKLGLTNIDWICAAVPEALKQLRKRREQFAKIVLDPPRSGTKGLEKELAGLNATVLAYVSCNPSTLARDLAGLAKHGYKLTLVQPIDLFPHTFHVEALGLLHKE
ncbi:MAG: 23S rRNA (uracil(1939)-C(5))-methyltransferase RlmD, partial [Deltaproteobacteria bacterium]|nr:23S rRNA (uracil(1939)-C(5))-methyltransferase RlmD [Deltaproteobacteria bacterium]